MPTVQSTTRELEKTPRGDHVPLYLVTQHQFRSSFGMELPEAIYSIASGSSIPKDDSIEYKEVAPNWPFWRMLAKHSAMHLYWCTPSRWNFFMISSSQGIITTSG